ncbi:MAG: prefoldin subunit alpha, partial [Candidatus Diapherotrites archaeon]|nr:prefoldin subunit alpha [Candidatus Diapherotrites archaeon]
GVSVEMSPKEAIARLRSGEAQMEFIQQQLVSMSSFLGELQIAKTTLSELPAKDAGSLLPLGAGVFLPSRFGSETVLVDTGAGAVVEKPVPDVLTLLEKRESEVINQISDLQTRGRKVAAETEKLRKKLAEYLEKQQSQGDVPMIG